MEFGDLRGILHYVPQFRNKLLVIKIDGSVVHSDNFSNVVLDLAVLNSLKINFIIVHVQVKFSGMLSPSQNSGGIGNMGNSNLEFDSRKVRWNSVCVFIDNLITCLF